MSLPSRDDGFTLIELLVVISLMGAMMAIAVGGWSAWAAASAHTGTARELQSVLRQAQQRAVTEGGATCVAFDTTSNSYSVFRGPCDNRAGKVSGPFEAGGRGVRFEAPLFNGTSTPTGVTFYARGTATDGTVKVTREGKPKVYTLEIERLTGRVDLR